MACLHTKVSKYLEANSKTWEAEINNIILQNDSDGNGEYIKSWNVSGLTEPTAEQLATYEADSNTDEEAEMLIVNRRREYPRIIDCIHALLDGGDTLTELQAKRTAVKNKYPKS